MERDRKRKNRKKAIEMKTEEAFLQQVREEAERAVTELLDIAKLEEGDLFVVGCSSSEVAGSRIGTDSHPDIAGAILSGIAPVLDRHGVYLAAQCCEHLNRALIVEDAARRAYRLERVDVVPQPKAGGSFATAAWQAMESPCAVEEVRARAGIDIGGTLIGMHLAPVAVPVRLSLSKIGEAILLCARTRPKFVGGERAHYQEDLL